MYLELVHSGNDYFERLRKMIEEASKEIHVQTYILEDDETGSVIVQALIDAAKRGVSVYVVADAFGSSALSKTAINTMTKHGVKFRFFSPFLSRNNFYIGRRLHHKVVVVDAVQVLVGGINIANKYRGNSNEPPWLDFAIQIEGEVAKPLQSLCRNVFFKKKKKQIHGIKTIFKDEKIEQLKVLQNDWLKGKNEIQNSYLKAIKEAKKEIIIVASYFLPGRRLIRALKKASRSGVKTSIVLSGTSDVPTIRNATRYLYSSLLKNKIEIYEWTQSVVHGKVALIDEELATIGSFNLNHLSSYGSVEMNIEIKSTAFAETFGYELSKIMVASEKITEESFVLKNTLYSRFVNWLSYRLMRMALIVITYFPYKRFWL